MNAKTLKMISGSAFTVAALSAIMGLYTFVSFYSSRKIDPPALTVATNLAAIILPVLMAASCFAKKDKLISYALIIMALFFAYCGVSSLATGLSMREVMDFYPPSYIISFYFRAIGDFLFAISAILGAVSTLAQKRSKGLYLAFAIIALVAAAMYIIGNALMQTLLAPNTLKALMEGVGFFALGMSYMKSIGENQTSIQESSAASLSSIQLSDYKQLLDQGIITQEEFNEQKKRFLQS